MKSARAVGFLVLVSCFVLLIGSCLDSGTEPPPNPFGLSTESLDIVPGSARTVTVSGGTPPYRVVSIDPALPQTITAVWDDSTSDPASLVITVLESATVGGDVSVVVGDAGPGDPIPVAVNFVAVGNISYSDDIQPIWDEYCGNRGCHPGGGAPFSLDRFNSYNNIYYVVVSNRTCGPPYRVTPFSLDSSLVYLMISGQTSCPRMPFSPMPGDTLPTAEQNKIRDWIDQGAFNN